MATELDALKNSAQTRRELMDSERGGLLQRYQKIEFTKQADFEFLYTLLCLMTHPNLTSLMARHPQENGEIKYLVRPDPEVCHMLLSIAIRLFSCALGVLPKFTNYTDDEINGFVFWVDAENNKIMKHSEA